MKSLLTTMIVLCFVLFAGNVYGQQGERRNNDRDKKVIIVDDYKRIDKKDKDAKIDLDDDADAGASVDLDNDDAGVTVKTDKKKKNDGNKETVTKKTEIRTDDGKKVKKTNKVKKEDK